MHSLTPNIQAHNKSTTSQQTLSKQPPRYSLAVQPNSEINNQASAAPPPIRTPPPTESNCQMFCLLLCPGPVARGRRPHRSILGALFNCLALVDRAIPPGPASLGTYWTGGQTALLFAEGEHSLGILALSLRIQLFVEQAGLNIA